MLVGCEFRHQTFDAILELTILAGVDERVDAAVGEQQNHREVVEPANTSDHLPEEQ